MNELFLKLESMPDYKTYKKESRIRALAALVMMVVFGAIVFPSAGFSELDEVSFIYLAIVFVGAVLSIRALFTSFFKKPKILLEGTISDIKETHTTDREGEKLITVVNHLYLVSDNKEEYWGQCIVEYNIGREKKHVLGERVLFFSNGICYGYIITL